jgi:hypothetical protein
MIHHGTVVYNHAVGYMQKDKVVFTSMIITNITTYQSYQEDKLHSCYLSLKEKSQQENTKKRKKNKRKK